MSVARRNAPGGGRAGWLALLLVLWLLPVAFAADPLADQAVAALAQLTDPARLERLSDDAFAAQLGPALGWLHVARRRDVAPESVIARAFRVNGLEGSERGRLNREALLRNLARADGWELFRVAVSAQALALGQPAVIQAGLQSPAHLARAEPEVTAGPGREFSGLTLRADDEPRPAPVPSAAPPPSSARRRTPRRAPARARAPTPAARSHRKSRCHPSSTMIPCLRRTPWRSKFGPPAKVGNGPQITQISADEGRRRSRASGALPLFPICANLRNLRTFAEVYCRAGAPPAVTWRLDAPPKARHVTAGEAPALQFYARNDGNGVA